MEMLDRTALEALGLASLGRDVQVSNRASIHGAARIDLVDHARIDDFCVLSAGAGGICIGHHVHVAVYCSLVGYGRIVVQEFANLPSRVSIYSSNDDYSDRTLTNPTVPAEYKGVTHAAVTIGRHAIVGSGSVILLGVTVGEGAAIGALSLIRSNCDPFGIYVGAPARWGGERSRELLEVEKRFIASTRA